MEDVNISKYRAQVVRAGSTPASPGFAVSEGQNPVDPSGSGQTHLPVTIATAATGLSITESQVLGGAGLVSQYIRGDGSLADFPASTGGGSSVSYYLNGSVSQGTIGGVAYKQLNRTPVFGAGTDISINADGYIASFITDASDPNKLLIPAGNWNFETYFSASSNGGSPSFYVELYKYDGTTFTLIATSSSAPELIAFGTSLNPYYSTLAVPQTTLALTDRLAIRYYVTHSGRTITLHTEDNHLCQIITTFTTGLTALNGLTAQVQNFAVGTSGTDFAIASVTATHTFNLPTASATNRGALSSADWSIFNAKQNSLTLTTTGSSGAATLVGATLNIPNYGSALAGYLPLTGGTLTGPLNGTSATFNHNDAPTIKIQRNGGTDTNTVLEFTNASRSFFIGSNGTVMGLGGLNGSIGTQPLQISSLGAITISNIAGSGTRMVVADSNGLLLTQAIPLGTVTSVTASSPLASSGGTTPNITIQQASGSQSGFLSSTDWTTFNSKQNALTNPVTGTGTSGQVAYFTGTTAISSESNLVWDAANNRLGINTTPAYSLDVNGTGQFGNTSNNTNAIQFLDANSTKTHLGSAFGATFIQNNNFYNGSAYVFDDNTVATSNITLSAGTINFQTGLANVNPSTKLTMFSNGNVFIGTSPSDNGARLQVSGTSTFSSSVTANYGGTFIIPSESPASGNVALIAITSNGANDIFRWFDGATPLGVFKNNGNVLIGTTTDNGSKLRVNGSLALPHVTKTANYTLDETDYTVGFDCASNRTANLPDATTCSGRIYVIYQYNTNVGLRYVTLDGNGSQTINGLTTVSLQYHSDYSSVMIQSNGSNWIIISDALYPSPV